MYEEENDKTTTTISPPVGTPSTSDKKEEVMMATAEAISSATLLEFESMKQFSSFQIYSLLLLLF